MAELLTPRADLKLITSNCFLSPEWWQSVATFTSNERDNSIRCVRTDPRPLDLGFLSTDVVAAFYQALVNTIPTEHLSIRQVGRLLRVCAPVAV